MEHLLWTEKYRPKTIEDCILPERLKKPFQEYVNQNNIPNLILSGGPGVGKTTVAKAMCNEIGCDFMVLMNLVSIHFVPRLRTMHRPCLLQVVAKSSSLTKLTI
jgi:replication factor C small subunit